MDQSEYILIEETIPLKKERKGGGSNLMLAALIAEAGRMLDEGFNKDAVEAAAVKVFGMGKGFLAVMESIGPDKALAFMKLLSDESDPDDLLFQKYDNFFSPPESLEKWAGKSSSDSEKANKSLGSGENVAEDFVLMDVLGRRFKGVCFMVAVDLVESGILGIMDVESICKNDFGWTDGPFGMMNRIGVEESLKIITEKMELSHRREINFPIPRKIIDQVGLKQPWMITS